MKEAYEKHVPSPQLREFIEGMPEGEIKKKLIFFCIMLSNRIRDGKITDESLLNVLK